MVHTCEICQAPQPRPTQKRATLSSWPALTAGVIRYCKLLIAASKENLSFLASSNHFTRWKKALPILNMFAETIAKLIKKNILLFGKA